MFAQIKNERCWSDAKVKRSRRCGCDALRGWHLPWPALLSGPVVSTAWLDRPNGFCCTSASTLSASKPSGAAHSLLSAPPATWHTVLMFWYPWHCCCLPDGGLVHCKVDQVHGPGLQQEEAEQRSDQH